MRTRAFQRKIHHRILFTNSVFFRMKISITPFCTFCMWLGERNLWAPFRGLQICAEIIFGSLHHTGWFPKHYVVFNKPTDQDIMLGITGNRGDCKLFKHLLILWKQSILYCRQRKVSPMFSVLQLRVHRIIEIETFFTKSILVIPVCSLSVFRYQQKHVVQF